MPPDPITALVEERLTEILTLAERADRPVLKRELTKLLEKAATAARKSEREAFRKWLAENSVWKEDYLYLRKSLALDQFDKEFSSQAPQE